MWRLTVFSGLISLALASEAYAIEPELWAEDILQYEKGLRELHIDLFNAISEDEFTSALNELVSTLSEKSDSEVILELMALTRRIDDGHTAIRANSNDRFPLELYYIDGTWKVVGVHEDHADMLGSSLVSIGGHPVNEVAEAIRPFLQNVENAYSEEIRLSESMVNAELLLVLNLISEEGAGTFVYSNQNGETSVRLIASQNGGGDDFFRYNTSEPVVRKVSELGTDFLWFGLLGDENAIYIRFSSYPTFEEMEAFGKELLAYIDSNHSSKLVIDFRSNGGGDFFVGLTLAYYLNLADSIDWKSGVFLLTDKYTFSAAVSNSAQFRQILNATIIGEPTGGNPVGYQDMGTFELQNSGLVVTYSKRIFRFQQQSTEGIQPDVLVEYDWDAYVNGVDNILQFVVDTISETKNAD
jgi:hypothetical protein